MDGIGCGNCQFSREEARGSVFDRDRGDGWGSCRRHAPVVIVITSPERAAFSQTAFPRVGEEDWCGQYEPVSQRVGGYAGLD